MKLRWRRKDAVFEQEVRPGGAGFKASDFVKRKVGGGGITVERLVA